MQDELILLNKKLDLLTTKVDDLTIPTPVNPFKWEDELHEIKSSLAFLTEKALIQERKQQEFEELKRDIIPIGNHFIKLTIDELAEIGTEFELEDLLYLLKRMLRNTDLILVMFDRIESLMGLADEAEILGKQVFSRTVENLDRMEREGYFEFAIEGWNILERIVQEFTKEDVEALGDNIVTILSTVRNMTQPEILAIANNAIGAISEDDHSDGKISTWSLIREMSDPKVRKGLARMLNMLKALSEQEK